MNRAQAVKARTEAALRARASGDSASAITRNGKPGPGDGRLAARLARELEGEVLFDAFSRGRYSTDASIYQIEPLGVVVPKSEADVARAVEIARDEDIPLLPRGGGTSQCGSRGMSSSRAISTARTTSASVFGTTTPSGSIW